MRKNAFTLIELLIVIIIIGILATIAIPAYKNMTIKTKIAEVQSTIGAIIKAEEIFYLQNGFMAAQDDEVAGYDLPYDYGPAFESILNITIPTVARKSYFYYGVYYDPATIFVRAVDSSVPMILVIVYLEGVNKGTWVINTSHPWYKLLNLPSNVTVTYSDLGAT